jgi:hypothetical protein
MTKQTLRLHFDRLRDDLGFTGCAGLALFAAAALFLFLVLKPVQEKSRLLEASLARHGGAAAGQAASGNTAANAADKLQIFYAYLDRGESRTDWLAKLYGIATATGVELQSGSYRAAAGEKTADKGDKADNGRIERYEIVLPVSGSYTQLREFLKRTLAEIPVLSLDQMTLKRESRNDGAVQAELKLTLHMVKK